jgi:hypothetical protein
MSSPHMTDDEPLTIDYRVTPREHHEATAALGMRRWPAGRPLRVAAWRGLVGWALFTGCAVMLYVLKRREGTDLLAAARDASIRRPLVAAAIAGAALGMLGLWLLFRTLAHRDFRAFRSRITLDATGITEEIPAGERGHRDWSEFSAWVETDQLLVVRFQGPAGRLATGMYFPKRLFGSTETLDRVKQLFRDHVRGPVG